MNYDKLIKIYLLAMMFLIMAIVLFWIYFIKP